MTLAAADYTQALRLAKEAGEAQFSRRQWSVVEGHEATTHVPSEIFF